MKPFAPSAPYVKLTDKELREHPLYRLFVLIHPNTKEDADTLLRFSRLAKTARDLLRHNNAQDARRIARLSAFAILHTASIHMHVKNALHVAGVFFMRNFSIAKENAALEAELAVEMDDEYNRELVCAILSAPVFFAPGDMHPDELARLSTEEKHVLQVLGTLQYPVSRPDAWQFPIDWLRGIANRPNNDFGMSSDQVSELMVNPRVLPFGSSDAYRVFLIESFLDGKLPMPNSSDIPEEERSFLTRAAQRNAYLLRNLSGNLRDRLFLGEETDTLGQYYVSVFEMIQCYTRLGVSAVDVMTMCGKLADRMAHDTHAQQRPDTFRCLIDWILRRLVLHVRLLCAYKQISQSDAEVFIGRNEQLQGAMSSSDISDLKKAEFMGAFEQYRALNRDMDSTDLMGYIPPERITYMPDPWQTDFVDLPDTAVTRACAMYGSLWDVDKTFPQKIRDVVVFWLMRQPVMRDDSLRIICYLPPCSKYEEDEFPTVIDHDRINYDRVARVHGMPPYMASSPGLDGVGHVSPPERTQDGSFPLDTPAYRDFDLDFDVVSSPGPASALWPSEFSSTQTQSTVPSPLHDMLNIIQADYEAVLDDLDNDPGNRLFMENETLVQLAGLAVQLSNQLQHITHGYLYRAKDAQSDALVAATSMRRVTRIVAFVLMEQLCRVYHAREAFYVLGSFCMQRDVGEVEGFAALEETMESDKLYAVFRGRLVAYLIGAPTFYDANHKSSPSPAEISHYTDAEQRALDVLKARGVAYSVADAHEYAMAWAEQYANTYYIKMLADDVICWMADGWSVPDYQEHVMRAVLDARIGATGFCYSIFTPPSVFERIRDSAQALVLLSREGQLPSLTADERAAATYLLWVKLLQVHADIADDALDSGLVDRMEHIASLILEGSDRFYPSHVLYKHVCALMAQLARRVCAECVRAGERSAEHKRDLQRLLRRARELDSDNIATSSYVGHPRALKEQAKLEEVIRLAADELRSQLHTQLIMQGYNRREDIFFGKTADDDENVGMFTEQDVLATHADWSTIPRSMVTHYRSILRSSFTWAAGLPSRLRRMPLLALMAEPRLTEAQLKQIAEGWMTYMYLDADYNFMDFDHFSRLCVTLTDADYDAVARVHVFAPRDGTRYTDSNRDFLQFPSAATQWPARRPALGSLEKKRIEAVTHSLMNSPASANLPVDVLTEIFSYASIEPDFYPPINPQAPTRSHRDRSIYDYTREQMQQEHERGMRGVPLTGSFAASSAGVQPLSRTRHASSLAEAQRLRDLQVRAARMHQLSMRAHSAAAAVASSSAASVARVQPLSLHLQTFDEPMDWSEPRNSATGSQNPDTMNDDPLSRW